MADVGWRASELQTEMEMEYGVRKGQGYIL